MKTSAGILLYRYYNKIQQIFLVHPGGPFWKNKDAGAWSIPKGEAVDGEELLDVAKREFHEETGHKVDGTFIPLGSVKMKSGKVIHAWALEGDIDADNIVSNTFQFEWPSRSGKYITIPEVERGEWFGITEAQEKINPAQVAFITKLVAQTTGK